MTRIELLTKALRVIQNRDDFLDPARSWLDDGLLEIENFGDWRFLQRETTHVLETNIDEVALSALKFPAAAITDFSKEMKVYRPGYGMLVEFPSRNEFNKARSLAETGQPTHFLVDYATGGESLFLFPKWISTLDATTLTLTWGGQIVLPDEDSDDLLTVSGVKPKMQVPLINYVRYRLFQQIDDDRQNTELAEWRQGLTKSFSEELTGNAAALSAGG